MLYLPISENTITTVLSAGDAVALETVSNALGRSQIAALFLIQKSATLAAEMLAQPRSAHQMHKALERQLAQFIEAGNELPQATLRDYFRRNHDTDALHQGLSGLRDLNVGLMSDDEAARQDYIDPDGGWAFGYRSSALPRRPKPVDEQQRILSDFRANRNEHLHVSGFAGTGKTRLIEGISAELDYDRLLLLAPTQHQLASVTGRLDGTPKKFTAMTIGKLASATLREHHLLKYDADTEGRMMHRLGLGDSALVTIMGYDSIGDLSPKQVVACVARMVGKYCHSRDANITLKHIPVEYQHMPREQREQVKALAQEYWRLLYYPDPDIKLPLREYHQVKMLALTDLPLPPRYSHLIVDEAHELSKPALQILDRATQASITLGDQYQVLQQRAPARRSKGVRQRQMLHSFRAGDNTSPLYNKLIASHPSAAPGEFEGDRNKKTTISYYERFAIPEQPCAILTRSPWHLFSLMQRLIAASARFYLLTGHRDPRFLSQLHQRNDLNQLIGDALELFHGSSRPSHRLLRQYDHWQDFMHAQDDPILKKVETAFRNGYGSAELEKAFASSEATLSPKPTEDLYIIGGVEDAKNHEFSRVMLMPDALKLEDDSEAARADRINHLYTAISRARDELMLPARLRDLVEQAGY